MNEDTSDDASPLRANLTCPVCLNIFKDPVSLPCGHTFCRECSKHSLSSDKRCPVCRKSAGEGGETSIFALRALSETYTKFSNWAAVPKAVGEDICVMHMRPLDLYCEKDEEPVCVDCVTLHSTHQLWSLKDGVPICKVLEGLFDYQHS